MTATDPGSGRRRVDSLVDDLLAESAGLRAVLAPRPAGDWARPTPAAGWTVTDQVTHLAYFDDVTRLSVTDPERFRAEAGRLTAGGQDFPDRVAAQFRGTPPHELLAWFDRSRAELARAFRAADPDVRLPWFGPAMSPASSVTARLMETWAHGQDILDTFGIVRQPTSRLRHVADIGIRARRYSYAIRGLELPADPVRVELTAPDGQSWTWGPAGAPDRVAGDALDFCLVVTQRRHRDDTRLEVRGPVASQWIAIAQAFAGAAGPGREPGHVQAWAGSAAGGL
ncbi:MAG TPA: TIGR03084 family metal-binding protein [Trebonia sp.]